MSPEAAESDVMVVKYPNLPHQNPKPQMPQLAQPDPEEQPPGQGERRQRKFCCLFHFCLTLG